MVIGEDLGGVKNLGVRFLETLFDNLMFSSVQFSSVAQSCPTLCDPRIIAGQASLSITNSWSSLRFVSIKSVMPSTHLILCCPLLLLPPNLSQHQGLFQ